MVNSIVLFLKFYYMFKNYLKIGYRSLLKQKIYSVINILGLSIGMASVVLIMLHVEDELSYDKIHLKGDRIYKLHLTRLYPDHITKYSITPHSFSDVMVEDFPEIETAVRLFDGPGNVVINYINNIGEEIAIEESLFMLADSTFFDVFSTNLIKGDPNTVLRGQQDIIITEEVAYKYFGDEDPLNKVLKFDLGGPQPFETKIVGVCENIPENSHFDFDFLASSKLNPFINNPNFYAFSAHIYLLLNEGASPESLEDKFQDMVLKYAAPQIEQNLNTTYEDYVAAGNGYDYHLVNLFDIHLNPEKYQGDIKPGGNKKFVNLFIAIAFLILVIACINFMNLATARSTERAREVGMRKTLGSQKYQLIYQFLTESVLISTISLLIALILIQLALPQFNSITQKTLSLHIDDSFILIGLLGFGILVGIIAGSYPAFILSAIMPAEILKGNMQTKKENLWLRNGLVVFQFTISIILMSGTLLFWKQMNFILNKDLGFDKEQVMIINNATLLGEQFESFHHELRAMPEIIETGSTNALPGGGFVGIQFKSESNGQIITVNGLFVDDNYLETLGFEMIDGRDFSPDFNDSANVVINEQTNFLLGVDNPIGVNLELQGLNGQNNRVVTIIGVVGDFHYMSIHNTISPFVFLNNEPDNIHQFIPVRIKSGNYQEAISKIEAKWNAIVPGQAFNYSFLDEDLQELYISEFRSGKILNIFALLAIIIACVGLFGLSAYTAALKTKEIGIRKVMGASVSNVVLMLSKDFSKLVIISIVIAIPVSWTLTSRWLEEFAYHTDLSAWIFIAASVTALLISWFTVGYQSIKAAIMNPVNSLRSE